MVLSVGWYSLFQDKQAAYLGVVITEEMGWLPYINSVSAKANGTLGYLQRNLKVCPKQLKEIAYMTLIRSKLEYSAIIWDPHFKKGYQKAGTGSTRYVNRNYDWKKDPDDDIKQLGWSNLAHRRRYLSSAL